MWEASRWNDDPTYHAPMVVCNGANVFAGDVVEFCTIHDGIEYAANAKLMSFLSMRRYSADLARDLKNSQIELP